MGCCTSISIVHTSVSTCVYQARKHNSFVQIKVNLFSLVPDLELHYLSHRWSSMKPPDNPALANRLLHVLLRKMHQKLRLSTHTIIVAPEELVFDHPKFDYSLSTGLSNQPKLMEAVLFQFL